MLPRSSAPDPRGDAPPPGTAPAEAAPGAGTAGSGSEDAYRRRWCWERVTWGTHCLNCLASCPYRVFARDGEVVFEEQSGTLEPVAPGVPDLNPLGCQKGSAWSAQLAGPDRLLHPLRRVGERGSGRFERVSWEEALGELADSILDAIETRGPESVVLEESVEGGLLAQAPVLRFAALLGALTLDANGLVNDFPTGQHLTFGKFSCASTVDDTFLADVVLLWHANPAYTSIPYVHFVAEARYRGATVVAVAPDYSASALGCDLFVPVRPGSDAALALGVCRVLLDEGLVDEAFVAGQTDLALLVRDDTRRFVRERDLVRGGREDAFYVLAESGPEPASRATLRVDGLPRLEGRATLRLLDGTSCDVRPVMELLRERLRRYAPEAVAPVCGVSPETVRTLARLVAGGRTKILEGFNAAKYYHGDLMERAMCLLLALTGNWGRRGTGIQGLALAGLDGYLLFSMKTRRGLDETARVLDGVDQAMAGLRARDPDASDEMLGNQLLALAASSGTSAPPVFFNYHHGGYAASWNRREWSDPAMTRSFDDYLRDAVRRGWWGGVARPGPDTPPSVLFCVGTNPLRRTRGGSATLLETLWPTLDKIVVVDVRMSATALHADLVLPAAMQYERVNVQYPVSHLFRLSLSEAAVPPRGESRTEWEIFAALSRAVSERAAARGLDEYLDGRRQSRRLSRLGEDFVMGGDFASDENVLDEWVRDSASAGTLPAGATLDTLRRAGSLRFTGLGGFSPGLSLATDVAPDEVLTAFRWHVERGTPFPTLTRRAQFYLDHPWFLEAGEELPCHKDPPAAGGDHPLVLTSGHSRWTVHSFSMGSPLLLGTHRGRPLVVLSEADAATRGVADGDEVRVENDHGGFEAMARVTPRVRPGQVIVYNGFEPHMFPGWRGANEVEPGMVKWLHLVGRYGHLRYLPFGWQPVPADRAVRVEVRRVGIRADLADASSPAETLA
jgi:DMSO reductase family type II enzyme molybdopterin subunit